MLAASSFALLLAGGVLPVEAATPAGIAPSVSGWVVVRKPTLASYTPDARDRGNSTGGTVTVTRDGVGSWEVTWAGLANAGAGTLQVSAIGSSLRHCTAYTWGSNGPNGYGYIHCYIRSNVPADEYGQLADVPFVAALVAEDGPVAGSRGRLGYAWMDLAGSDGTPSLSYNYSSAGGSLTVDRTDVGAYTMTVPGAGKGDGVVVVTGYEGSLRRCQVRDWFLDGTDLTSRVDCVDFRGVLADAQFDYLYIRRVGLEGYGGGPAASLWADRPTAASYHPNPSYAWSSAGKQSTIRRTSKGVYAVALPGMPKGGAAIVTSYGGRSHQRACQIGSIRTTRTPQQVVVRCFTYNGAPADSRFVLSYTH